MVIKRRDAPIGHPHQVYNVHSRWWLHWASIFTPSSHIINVMTLLLTACRDGNSGNCCSVSYVDV